MIRHVKQTVRDILFHAVCRLLPTKNEPMYTDKTVGIVSLLGHEDVDKYIYTIASFFYHLQFQLPLCIVNDGTLTQADKRELHRRFKISIEDDSVFDKKIAHIYHRYSFLFRNRFATDNFIYKKKLDALVASPYKRTILLDSDVLFYNKPIEIIHWIRLKPDIILHLVHERKTRHKGILVSQAERTCRVLLKKYLYPQMNPDFNSGLVCIPDTAIIDLRLLNSIFKHFFSLKIEEDLFLSEEIALSIVCSSYLKHKALNPAKYIVSALDVDYSSQYRKSAICIHYAAKTAKRFYKDALINVYKRWRQSPI